ncbi:hypothetical protein FPV67DRAFT_383880 [Lyophyllum atratum]|nr:hypothetical protein FPV67DRAFT_383880 [Lyophyllum atratum]
MYTTGSISRRSAADPFRPADADLSKCQIYCLYLACISPRSRHRVLIYPSRRVRLDISLLTWNLNTVNSVFEVYSPSSVHTSSFPIHTPATFGITTTHSHSTLPLEKVDASSGHRLVLCTICHTYINHGKDNITTTGLRQHQRTQKCKLALADRILAGLDNARTAQQPENPSICDGTVFHWDLGSPFVSYPFALHDPESRFTPGYTICSVDTQRSTIRVRSLHCTRSAPTSSPACSASQNIGSLIEAVKRHAERPTKGLDNATLSHRQPPRLPRYFTPSSTAAHPRPIPRPIFSSRAHSSVESHNDDVFR